MLNLCIHYNKSVQVIKENDEIYLIDLISLDSMLNLSDYPKFQSKASTSLLINKMSEILEITSTRNEFRLKCLTIIYNFTKNESLREQLIESNDQAWKMLIDAISDCNDLTNVALSSLVNLTSIKSTNLDLHSTEIMQKSLELSSQNDFDLTLILIGNLLQKSSHSSSLIKLVKRDFILKLIANVRENNNQQQSVKLLALSTQLDDPNVLANRKIIIQADKCMNSFLELKKTNKKYNLFNFF